MPTLANDIVPEVVGRLADLLSTVGLSIIPDATNADAMRAIGWGFRTLGLIPLSGGLQPGDADLATMTVHTCYDLADLAEYRLLVTCRNRWTQVTVRVGSGELRESDLRDSMERRIVDLEGQLKARFGFGMQQLTGGTILTPDPLPVPIDEFASTPGLLYDPSGW